MTGSVFIKEYSAPTINRREILRYMGVRAPSDSINALIDSCLTEISSLLAYRVCALISDVHINEKNIKCGGLEIHSSSLASNLIECDKVAIFSATIGIGIDRCISKYSRVSPSRAYCIQAIGAERIEQLCDMFNKEIKSEFGETAPRFSPGYGDLELSVQKDIFTLLNSQKNIGLTLTDTMIMSPSKSVTAFIGIKRKE